MSDPSRLPGWYPDPERPGRSRWWDGHEWSDARAAAVPQGPAQDGRVDGYAVASLLSALLFFPIVPIVLGFVARRRIARAQGTLTGDALALGGIGIGFVVLAICLLGLVLFLTEESAAALAAGL